MASGRRGLCFAPSSGSLPGSLAGAGDGRKEMLKHFQKMLVKTFKKCLMQHFLQINVGATLLKNIDSNFYEKCWF
jgi:hypothetical protein